MEFCNRLSHLTECSCRRLYNQEPFRSFLYLALPTVDGRNLGDDVDAGGKASLDQMTRDFAGFFLRGSGGEDDSFVGHIESGGGNSSLR